MGEEMTPDMALKEAKQKICDCRHLWTESYLQDGCYDLALVLADVVEPMLRGLNAREAEITLEKLAGILQRRAFI